MTIGELQNRMTRREFEAWQAYDLLYPIGQKGDQAAAAFRDAILFNGEFGTEKNPQPIKDWRNLIPDYLLQGEIQERKLEEIRAKEAALKAYLMGLS